MKKLFLVFAVLLAIVVAGNVNSTAQEPSFTEYVVYTVKSGNTLWGLTGSQWEKVVQANPWLESRVERKSADLVIVRIYPGERILIPKGSGIEKTLRLDPPVMFTVSGSSGSSLADKRPDGSGSYTGGSSLWWVWLLLGLGTIALAVAYFARRAFRNPATAGPAIIPGGIPPGDTRAIEDHFATVAWRRYLQIDPGADHSATRIERVSPIEEGFLSGWGFVLFDNFRRLFMYLKRELAYRARFRFPNGTEEELFFIQRCANDAYRGTRYRGFRFEPRVHGASIPTPTPPTEEPARRQATALHLVDRENPDVEPTRIKVVGAEIDIPSGGIIDIDSRGNCVVTVCGVTFAVKARRPAQTRSMKPAAAATSDGGTQ